MPRYELIISPALDGRTVRQAAMGGLHLSGGQFKRAKFHGALLLDGIGDTVRVSITGDPVQEVRAAREILQCAGRRIFSPEIVACPTCARTRIQLEPLYYQVKAMTQDIPKYLKIAVMGCPVNGPGEAREADYGVAGGKGCGLLFKKGEIVRKVPESELCSALMELIESGEGE